MTKVMISSSLLDLEDARKAIIDSCNRFEFQPIAMEHEAAANSDVVEKSLAMVEEADWYILVIGYRYGSSLPGDPRSITEIEYDHAVTLGKQPSAVPHVGGIPADKISPRKGKFPRNCLSASPPRRGKIACRPISVT